MIFDLARKMKNIFPPSDMRKSISNSRLLEIKISFRTNERNYKIEFHFWNDFL